MKYTTFSICLLIVFLLFSCNKAEEKKTGLPVVDVTKNYPEKEIFLQDIAEVEYVSLETKDDVLIDNFSHLYCVSSDTIIIGNGIEGSVFIFDGKGRILSQFNNKGASNTEYQEIWGLKVDRKNQEVIVIDYPFQHRMQVYDMSGGYKRTLSIDKKYSFLKDEIINYNDETLLCYDRFDAFKAQQDSSTTIFQPFVLISKKDGAALGNLPITLTKRVDPDVMVEVDEGMSVFLATLHSVLTTDKGVILSDCSLDTTYTYTKEEKLEPILARTPKILEMDEPLTLMQVEKLSPDYIWAKTIKKVAKKEKQFLNNHLLVDRKTNEVFKYRLINKDAPELQRFLMVPNDNKLLITADKLKEALEDGKLSGELAEIAKRISVEDNPVLMKIKFKK